MNTNSFQRNKALFFYLITCPTRGALRQDALPFDDIGGCLGRHPEVVVSDQVESSDQVVVSDQVESSDQVVVSDQVESSDQVVVSDQVESLDLVESLDQLRSGRWYSSVCQPPPHTHEHIVHSAARAALCLTS
ncbi:unnamed protein product [Boreogadus saida]